MTSFAKKALSDFFELFADGYIDVLPAFINTFIVSPIGQGLVANVEALTVNETECAPIPRAVDQLGPSFEIGTITVYLIAFTFCTFAVLYHTNLLCAQVMRNLKRRSLV